MVVDGESHPRLARGLRARIDQGQQPSELYDAPTAPIAPKECLGFDLGEPCRAHQGVHRGQGSASGELAPEVQRSAHRSSHRNTAVERPVLREQVPSPSLHLKPIRG